MRNGEQIVSSVRIPVTVSRGVYATMLEATSSSRYNTTPGSWCGLSPAGYTPTSATPSFKTTSITSVTKESGNTDFIDRRGLLSHNPASAPAMSERLLRSTSRVAGRPETTPAPDVRASSPSTRPHPVPKNRPPAPQLYVFQDSISSSPLLAFSDNGRILTLRKSPRFSFRRPSQS
jgi:hypothetical protein